MSRKQKEFLRGLEKDIKRANVIRDEKRKRDLGVVDGVDSRYQWVPVEQKGFRRV